MSSPLSAVAKSPVGGGGSVESEAGAAVLAGKVQTLEAGHESLEATGSGLMAQNAKLKLSLVASSQRTPN